MHAPADFLEQSITFLHIVMPARSDHIGPHVAAASTPRDDVVDRVSVFEAVRATVSITKQERSPREGRRADLGGQTHHVVEANDGRDGHAHRTRTTD